MYCTQCGSELKERSQFCNACGRRIPPGSGAVSWGTSASPAKPRRVKKHYPMRTAALLLGLVTAAILLSNGYPAYRIGNDPNLRDSRLRSFFATGDSTYLRPIRPDPYIVVAGTLAMATGALLLGAATLANVALRMSLALFGLALLGAIWTVLVDYYSPYATRYFMAFPLIGACVIVMLVAWRKEKRTDSSVLDG